MDRKDKSQPPNSTRLELFCQLVWNRWKWSWSQIPLDYDPDFDWINIREETDLSAELFHVDIVKHVLVVHFVTEGQFIFERRRIFFFDPPVTETRNCIPKTDKWNSRE